MLLDEHAYVVIDVVCGLALVLYMQEVVVAVLNSRASKIDGFPRAVQVQEEKSQMRVLAKRDWNKRA